MTTKCAPIVGFVHIQNTMVLSLAVDRELKRLKDLKSTNLDKLSKAYCEETNVTRTHRNKRANWWRRILFKARLPFVLMTDQEARDATVRYHYSIFWDMHGSYVSKFDVCYPGTWDDAIAEMDELRRAIAAVTRDATIQINTAIAMKLSCTA